MKKSLMIVSIVSLALSLGWGSPKTFSAKEDLPAGWTPAQSSEWQGIQVAYAHAVKTYGYRSSQAKSARARKEKMAKLLKMNTARVVIAPRVSASSYNPGTNGTIAPALLMENVKMASRD